jgi:hypothetical protein
MHLLAAGVLQAPQEDVPTVVLTTFLAENYVAPDEEGNAVTELVLAGAERQIEVDVNTDDADVEEWRWCNQCEGRTSPRDEGDGPYCEGCGNFYVMDVDDETAPDEHEQGTPFQFVEARTQEVVNTIAVEAAPIFRTLAETIADAAPARTVNFGGEHGAVTEHHPEPEGTADDVVRSPDPAQV